MTTDVSDLDSGWSTGLDTAGGFYRDFSPAIGNREDPPAASEAVPQSSCSLLKGILAGFGVGAGSGTVNATPRLVQDPEAAIGEPNDERSVGSAASVTAILKKILQQLGL